MRRRDFPTTKKKQPSDGHMYECISLDIVKSTDSKIESIIDQVMDCPSEQQIGNGPLSWNAGCRLPRIVCVNVQVPFFGLNVLGYKDPGCSIVAMFHITGETLHRIEDPNCEPCLKQFMNFVDGPAGRLDNRCDGKDNSGVLKAIAYCTNLDRCLQGLGGMASVARNFNGKPCLISKSGFLKKGPQPPGIMGAPEWIEMSVDLRLFATAAREMLRMCRDRIATASIHVGFLVQASDEEDLPEGLIGDVVLHTVHLENDAADVTDKIRAAPAMPQLPVANGSQSVDSEAAKKAIDVGAIVLQAQTMPKHEIKKIKSKQKANLSSVGEHAERWIKSELGTVGGNIVERLKELAAEDRDLYFVWCLRAQMVITKALEN
jgi:hypothetical protein